MSKEHRRPGSWLLPVLIAAVGVSYLVASNARGALSVAALKPINRVGLGVMLAGLVLALFVRKRPLARLAGVMLCGVGAILVICL